MKLKATYEKEDDIPEAHRELFTERDGKWELTGVEGIRTDADVTRLQGSLDKERKDHKETKSKLRAWTSLGEDTEAVQAKLDRADELEAAGDGKIDDAKIQELADKRAKALTGPLERKIAKLEGDLSAVTGERDEARTTITRGKVDTALRRAAEAAKVTSSAIEDIVAIGGAAFELTEDGKVVTRDANGAAPGLSPETWLGDMREARPHWWPASTGGGAKGGGGDGAFSKNPWSKDHWNLTEQGRIVQTKGEDAATRMAEAAGSRIGATGPTR